MIKRTAMLAFAVGTSIHGNAHAASWWFIGESSDGSAYLADASSLNNAGDKRDVWIWSFNKVPRKGVYETKSRVRIDCSSETILTTTYLEYGSDGSVMYSRSSPSYETAQPIVPDSMGEAFAHFACHESDWIVKYKFFGPLADPEKAFKYHPRAPKAHPATGKNQKSKRYTT